MQEFSGQRDFRTVEEVHRETGRALSLATAYKKEQQ